jgi:hypothetical protein
VAGDNQLLEQIRDAIYEANGYLSNTEDKLDRVIRKPRDVEEAVKRS